MTISITVIRVILTLALLVPVFRETGPWTVAVLALLTFAIEIQSALLRVLLAAAKSVAAIRGTTT